MAVKELVVTRRQRAAIKNKPTLSLKPRPLFTVVRVQPKKPDPMNEVRRVRVATTEESNAVIARMISKYGGVW